MSIDDTLIQKYKPSFTKESVKTMNHFVRKEVKKAQNGHVRKGPILFTIVILAMAGGLLIHIGKDEDYKDKAINFTLDEDEDYYSKLRQGNNILIFWGSYCPHCEDVLSKIVKSDNPDLKDHLFTVSMDEDIKAISKWVGTIPIYLDFDQKVMKEYKIENIPTVFVISESGSILDKAVGGHKAQDLLVRYYLRE